MSIEKMVLMPAVDKLIPLTQAVMYEVTAAKYIMLGIHDFRRLVEDGVILCRTHPGRSRKIYLKTDLDDYLKSLPRCNIGHGRVRPGPEGKGNQGDRS
jgi:hypothetical protein